MKGFLKKNEGFSLFTVLIAISFIGILGMLLLYIAVANFHMKTTDLKGKDSFYTAEQALEEIRTGLQQDVGEAMSEAYLSVMETYNENNGGVDATLDELRLSSFKELYVKSLGKRLEGGVGQYSLDTLRSYVDLSSSAGFDGTRETLVVTNPSGTYPQMVKSVKSGVVLKNLKVIYVDEKGRASVIETDIRLGMPKIQFPTPSTLPDLMNMIVVADGGILCENKGSVEGISIQGSLYAGLLSDTNLPSGVLTPTSILVQPETKLTITRGDKLVCEGELRVEENGSFSDGGEVTLWAQGVTLSSAEVKLCGKTYLADDLTVEAGKGSRVTVEGEYYGYGSPESARNSYNGSRFENWTDAALSSAVVINGKGTTLDLSGTTKMMLAGKNYVASSKVRGFTAGGGAFENDKTKNIMTGESLTVKGTQIAYLLPPQLIAADGYEGLLHNPMSYEEYTLSGLLGKERLPLDMQTPVPAWGGKSLGEIGVDETLPVREVYYNNNSENGYVYFYLNFTDDTKAAVFMNEYYQNNPAAKANMDAYLSFYFPGENTGIRLNDKEAYLRYVTNGNVLSYDGKEEKGELLGATNTEKSEELLQEQKNYQNMWYALNRKMIGSYDLLKTKVTDSEGISHDETDASRSVFDNLVNEKEMVQFIYRELGGAGWKYEFTADSDDGGLKVIMAHNGEKSVYQELAEGSTAENPLYQEAVVPGSGEELVIDAAMAEKLRLVVCTGNVRILSGVHFQGIIMAKGKITLESGASLVSAPLEAAKVFQAQMNAGANSPKDFFWEGDRYVLGNSSSNQEGNGSGSVSNTYEVSQAITYENWKKR